ncbi:hypothetical protein [Lapidilactobacillus gannanensis]|uniref:Uncharacterized protein n=1 Tax=Lapidilactobacillus gannanensis TaxID=2486002 RepID=A0ABW4BKN0_9LACO|nr:hypothetical protein [Lapidilactobacillus gannanensis]
MKQAVIVFNSEPILGNLMPSQFRLDGNIKHYRRTLLQEIGRLDLPWQVSLDQTFGDIASLIAAHNQLLICAPGLEHQLFFDKADQNKLIFLTSLEFRVNDVQRVIKQMQLISGKNL